MSLRARLLLAREAKELSLAALSKRCGVTKAYLVRAEHDDTNLSIAIVERIAAGLDVRPAWLAICWWLRSPCASTNSSKPSMPSRH